MLQESAPIVVTEDGAVIRRKKIVNGGGVAITVQAHNVTIQECDITGAINLYGAVSGTVIQNNYIHDMYPKGQRSYSKQFAGVMTTEGHYWPSPIVQPLGASDISIIGNYFENLPSGVVLVGCKGPILIQGNFNQNQRGPFPRGQAFQVSMCDGTTGSICIDHNFSYVDYLCDTQFRYTKNGKTGAEDHINVFMSSGSEAFPITVSRNWICGGSGSLSGSGIMMGDGGGHHYHVYDNRIYDTGNAGIGLSGGSHWHVKGNRIYQSPANEQYDGRGLQIECYGDPFGAPILVEENEVFWECGKREQSLFCATDLVTFRNNTIGQKFPMDQRDLLPPFEPLEPVAGLLKPWAL